MRRRDLYANARARHCITCNFHVFSWSNMRHVAPEQTFLPPCSPMYLSWCNVAARWLTWHQRTNLATARCRWATTKWPAESPQLKWEWSISSGENQTATRTERYFRLGLIYIDNLALISFHKSTALFVQCVHSLFTVIKQDNFISNLWNSCVGALVAMEIKRSKIEQNLDPTTPYFARIWQPQSQHLRWATVGDPEPSMRSTSVPKSPWPLHRAEWRSRTWQGQTLQNE